MENQEQPVVHVKIPVTPVVSSNIKAVGYVADTQTLRVQFGKISYDYFGVSKETYEEFVQAESVGSYFHRNIRTKVTGVRVPAEFIVEEEASTTPEEEVADEPKEV